MGLGAMSGVGRGQIAGTWEVGGKERGGRAAHLNGSWAAALALVHQLFGEAALLLCAVLGPALRALLLPLLLHELERAAQVVPPHVHRRPSVKQLHLWLKVGGSGCAPRSVEAS